MDKLHEYEVFDSDYSEEISDGIVEEAISRFVSLSSAFIIRYIIRPYSAWSSQTYEGNRISHSIGILGPSKSKKDRTESNIFAFNQEDFLKIIGSSHDSILAVDRNGNILAVENLNMQNDDDVARQMQAPISMAHLARWTHGGKIALTVTRSGEILLFKDRTLCFAKRRGSWRYFPHDLITKKMFRSGEHDETSMKLRKAMYLTALDTAFNRSGACLGLIKNTVDMSALKCLPQSCLLEARRSKCSLFLASIISGKKFYNLSRTIRAELCALDGATILASDGTIIAAGAILKTGGNSEGGGGRSAAAKALSKYGLGIKVSNDGYITIKVNRKQFSFA